MHAFGEVFDVPISINGEDYGTLQHHLEQAFHLLDPHVQTEIQSPPCAFGFGDGHEENVMVSLDDSLPSLLYVDYEVTGYHTPFLDLAKPIYLDCFFNAMYADLLCEYIPRKNDNGKIWVDWSWTIEKDRLCINYGFTLEPLWTAPANVKFEYILRPVLEMLEELAPSQRDTAEEILACGLFCCALLTRNHSTWSDVFYLNLALGIRLATEMKDVFSECFGWNNWPPSSLHSKEVLPRATPGPRS